MLLDDAQKTLQHNKNGRLGPTGNLNLFSQLAPRIQILQANPNFNESKLECW
uniref:Uncharacterized protein n=1 Tax=Romanomermis culicivorax TaxID=13658 RepID=A0A915JUA7_ROMCU